MIGAQIKLRAMEPEDIDTLYHWENDQSVWHLSNTVTPFSRFEIEQYVLNAERDIFVAKQLRLMIAKKENEEAVGAIDLFDFDPLHRRLGLGILITNPEQGKGFASEALKLVIEYCFHQLMAHQIFANIMPDNDKSIGLFEKNGFKPIGVKKDWLLINNKWNDEIMYQLINPYK